jgi:hypothetical protein
MGTNRSYMRAAAVLTGKSLTSSQLAEKTSLPLGECRQFIGKLGDSQCLEIAAAGSAPSGSGFAATAGAPSPQPRMAAAIASAPASSPAKKPDDTSLFSRIRSRLNFLGKAAT